MLIAICFSMLINSSLDVNFLFEFVLVFIFIVLAIFIFTRPASFFSKRLD